MQWRYCNIDVVNYVVQQGLIRNSPYSDSFILTAWEQLVLLFDIRQSPHLPNMPLQRAPANALSVIPQLNAGIGRGRHNILSFLEIYKTPDHPFVPVVLCDLLPGKNVPRFDGGVHTAAGERHRVVQETQRLYHVQVSRED